MGMVSVVSGLQTCSYLVSYTISTLVSRTKIYGEDGPSHGANAPGEGRAGQCKTRAECAERVPYCSKLGYCHGGRLPFDEAQLEITVSLTPFNKHEQFHQNLSTDFEHIIEILCYKDPDLILLTGRRRCSGLHQQQSGKEQSTVKFKFIK